MAATIQRDLFIDYAKGLATLSVIFIHTAFWSGQYYIPHPVRILSLVFDVPLFFALSGITSGNNIEKTFYRLLKLQISYMIFVTFLFFLDVFFKIFGLSFFGLEDLKNFYSVFGSKYIPSNLSTDIQWQTLGNWYVHSYTKCDTFPVVMGSFWFLKVYFILSVFGVLILRFFQKHINWFIGLCLVLTAIFNLLPQYFPSGQTSYVALYLAVFLLGHQIKGKILPVNWSIALFALFFAILLLLYFNNGTELFMTISKKKFPPRDIYIFWMSFSLITLFTLYNRWKIKANSFITSIGRNAIFYYFAQGISSSLIYFLVFPLKDQVNWILLMLVTFLVNLLLAVVLVKFIEKLDGWGWKILGFLRKKTAKA